MKHTLMRSPSRAALVVATIVAAALVVGCAAERNPGELWGPSEEGTVVVEAILRVDGLLPNVRVTRASAPDRIPSGADGVRNAIVQVRTGTETIEFFAHPQNHGLYVPTTSHLVQPGAKYDLLVLTREGERVSATTTTPERFVVDDWLLLEDDLSIRKELATFEDWGDVVFQAPENQLVYADGLLEARFRPPNATAMQVGLISLDRDSPFVIDPDFFSEEDFESLERANSSPAFSGEDGTLRLPWFSIFFEGRYLIRIWAVDANWYDYIRSDPELAAGGPGFGGNAGDAFERPVFHVEGGIGLFGSAASDSIGFTILPIAP